MLIPGQLRGGALSLHFPSLVSLGTGFSALLPLPLGELSLPSFLASSQHPEHAERAGTVSPASPLRERAPRRAGGPARPALLRTLRENGRWAALGAAANFHSMLSVSFPAESDRKGEMTVPPHPPGSRCPDHASWALVEEKQHFHVALIRDTQRLQHVPSHLWPRSQSSSLECEAP